MKDNLLVYDPKEDILLYRIESIHNGKGLLKEKDWDSVSVLSKFLNEKLSHVFLHEGSLHGFSNQLRGCNKDYFRVNILGVGDIEQVSGLIEILDKLAERKDIKEKMLEIGNGKGLSAIRGNLLTNKYYVYKYVPTELDVIQPLPLSITNYELIPHSGMFTRRSKAPSTIFFSLLTDEQFDELNDRYHNNAY